jgi:hypothetical protein
MKLKLMLGLAGWALTLAAPAEARDLWTKAQAHSWYDRQPWLVGANYNPASAINQFEMWQAETWNPTEIDKELGWAQSIGMNTMRVYLHNMLWENDPEGPEAPDGGVPGDRAAARDPADVRAVRQLLGPEPGRRAAAAADPRRPQFGLGAGARAPRGWRSVAVRKLESYVKGVVGHFRNDPASWPGTSGTSPNNEGGGNYPNTPEKKRLIASLLDKSFDWAQSVDPVQPLTSGLWTGESWDKRETLDAVERVQITRSDVNSFHDYNWPEQFERRARQMLSYGRPVLCTEYMARGNGSTFDGSLPVGKRLNIAMINWGLVDGKTQTRLPWDSWKKPYTYDEPPIWFHEVFRADGTPYRKAETDLIRTLASQPKVRMPMPMPARRHGRRGRHERQARRAGDPTRGAAAGCSGSSGAAGAAAAERLGGEARGKSPVRARRPDRARPGRAGRWQAGLDVPDGPGSQLDAWTSTDLTRWTRAGTLIKRGDIAWLPNGAPKQELWAPHMAAANGKFYLYYRSGRRNRARRGPASRSATRRRGRASTVAARCSTERTRTTSRCGPPAPAATGSGRPAPGRFRFEAIDPMVFVDPKSGRRLLYAGGSNGSTLRVFELAPDMVTVAREVPVEQPPCFTEGPWMHERGGIYYLSYSSGNWDRANYSVRYAVSLSPTGPWRYGGAILVGDGTYKGPGHHAFFRDPRDGSWLIAYHRWEYQRGDGPFDDKRKIAIARVTYRPDGAIEPIVIAR